MGGHRGGGDTGVAAGSHLRLSDLLRSVAFHGAHIARRRPYHRGQTQRGFWHHQHRRHRGLQGAQESSQGLWRRRSGSGQAGNWLARRYPDVKGQHDLRQRQSVKGKLAAHRTPGWGDRYGPRTGGPLLHDGRLSFTIVRQPHVGNGTQVEHYWQSLREDLASLENRLVLGSVREKVALSLSAIFGLLDSSTRRLEIINVVAVQRTRTRATLDRRTLRSD